MQMPIAGPTVWRAADMAATDRWRIPIAPGLANAMATAADRALATGVPPAEIGRRQFAPPEAEALWARIHDEVENGVGFAVISGLPFADLDYAGQAALTLGLADHIGRVAPQNYELQRVVDVRDDGIEYSHRSRGYRSAKALPFHTDGAHLFALACLGIAAEGGETIIVSGAAVFNALLEENPAALDLLAHGFFHHRRGQHDPGEPPLSPGRVPVFTVSNGLLHCCYNRNPIEWAEREGVKLTVEERRALDVLDSVLAREEMQFRLDLKPGECAIINNFITLHSRTEYRDGPGSKRHLLRVWMSDPTSRRNGFSLLDLYVPKAAAEAALAGAET